ncbi:hypothetical protein, partial [Francisella tularensis]|uniref:hypothetical protein n=1 Tax=Francisella tularensis TaxID=263 RepID=UPI002381C8FB
MAELLKNLDHKLENFFLKLNILEEFSLALIKSYLQIYISRIDFIETVNWSGMNLAINNIM